MTVRTALAAVVAALLLLAPTAGAAEQAYAENTVVGQDPAGDWGTDPNAAPVGAALGQDLTGASITMPNAETLEFVIKVTGLPANGGAPEATRYVWDVLVDGNFLELDGKWSNYSRGACDPTSGACPPPRDPGMQPFFLRGDCVAGEGNVTTCKEIGKVKGVFNAAAGTITIPVPAALIKAGACSVIAPGPNIFGGSVSASPSAFFSSSAAPLDSMELESEFQVPSADPLTPCPAPAPAE